MTERSSEAGAPAKQLSVAERLMDAASSHQPGKPKSEIVDEYIERLKTAKRDELLQELRNAIVPESDAIGGFSQVLIRAMMVNGQLNGNSAWNDALIPDLQDECRRFFVAVSYGLGVPGVKDLLRTIRVERNSHPDTKESTKIGCEFFPINELSAVETLLRFTMNLLGSVDKALDDAANLADLKRFLSHANWADVKKCEDAAKQEILRFNVVMRAAVSSIPGLTAPIADAGGCIDTDADLKSNAGATTSQRENEDKTPQLISALVKYHEFDGSSVGNPAPVGCTELAIAAGVVKSTASNFFAKHFRTKRDDPKSGSWKAYKQLCLRSTSELVLALQSLTRELPLAGMFDRSNYDGLPSDDEADD